MYLVYYILAIVAIAAIFWLIATYTKGIDKL